MQQSKNGRRVGRVGVISALLPTTVSVGGRLMANLSPSLPLPWREKKKSILFNKIKWPYKHTHTHTTPATSKQESMDCFKHALRNDYRGTPTKRLIVHCRWHISQGAFIAAWPLKSESCWVRGELAHTCITEEGTPVHPAAWTRRVDPANPGVKADQRTGPKSSASSPTTLLAFSLPKKKKVTSIDFGGYSGKTQRVK